MRKDEIQPLIISDREISEVKRDLPIWEEVNIYEVQAEELFEIRNPSGHFSADRERFLEEFLNDYFRRFPPVWIYFPWNGVLLRMVQEQDFYELKSNRNQLLITKEEQLELAQTVIGVMGLSVGGAIVVNLVASLQAGEIRMGDHDILSTSNLNRILLPVAAVDEKKSTLIAQHCMELNPFQRMKVFDNGIHPDNLNEFLNGSQKLDIVIDAIDDFEMKVRIRLEAKKSGTAVVMLTNLGNRILVDVERFDLEPEREIFHGLIPDVAREILETELDEDRKKKYAVQIVGREHVPDRAMNTLKEIGTTLVGRPQLMSSVQMTGGLAGFIVRKIVLENMPSGRHYINYDAIFDSE